MDVLKRLNWFTIATLVLGVGSLVYLLVLDKTGHAGVLAGLSFVSAFLGSTEE